MFHSDSILRACTLALLVGSASNTAVQAQEVTFDSSIRTRTTFDDNVVLGREGSEIVSFFQRTTPSFTVGANTETWRASLSLDVSFLKFEDDGFDSDDQNLRLSFLKATEKVVWQVQASDRRSNTRDTQLEDFGGILFETNRREIQNLRPVMQWTVNPKNQLVVGLSAENTHYDGLEFRDYDYYGADIGWNHQWDEKTRIELGVFANDFASVAPFKGIALPPSCSIFNPIRLEEDFDSETVGATLGGRRQASEKLSYNASFGYRQVDSISSGRQCPPPGFLFGVVRPFENTSDSTGLVMSSGLDYVGEKYSLSLALSRSISPIGLGLLSEQDVANLAGEYTFSPTLTANLTARWQDSESVDDASLFSRRSVRVSPRLRWRYNEQLTLELGANYRTTKGQQDTSRDGTQLYVGAAYIFKQRKKTL